MENIAVVRRNGLGDLLCAYPLIRYLQTKKGASVTLFIDQRNAPLIPYLPKIEQVVVFPSKGFKYWNMLRTAIPHRKQFDVAVSAKTSPMKLINFFLFCLGAKKRIAYVDPNKSSKFINQPLQFDVKIAKSMHQALKGLRTVDETCLDVPEEFYPVLHIPQKIKDQYPKPQKSSYPTLLVSATSNRKTSSLAPKRYGSILNRLHTIYPFNVLIIAEKNDHTLARAIQSELSMDCSVHFPRNFDEFMVLLDASDVLLVGDGGTSHLGAALGKAAVVLFGITNPIEWRPLSKKVETLYHPEHVDHIDDEAIFQALKEKVKEWKI